MNPIESAWRDFTTSGAEDDFSRFFEATRDAVYTICRRLTRSPEEAEDAFQNTYLRLLRERPADPAAIESLLLRTAAREADALAHREARRARREVALDEAAASSGEAPIAGEQARLRTALEQLIDILPRHDKAAVALHYLHGMTHEQVGAALGLPRSTVTRRLRAAIERLRRPAEQRGLRDALGALLLVMAAARLDAAPSAISASGVLALEKSGRVLPALPRAATSASAGISAAIAVAVLLVVGAVLVWWPREEEPAPAISVAIVTEDATVHSTQPVAPRATPRAAAESSARDADTTPDASTGPRVIVGRIEGRVLDDSGNPVAGATAELLAPWGAGPPVILDSRTTDAAGRYEFGGLSLQSYLLRARRDNVVGIIERVDVMELLRMNSGEDIDTVFAGRLREDGTWDSTEALDLRLPDDPMARTFLVVDAYGAPIAGATVHYIARSFGSIDLRTDGEGRATTRVPRNVRDVFGVNVWAPGYRARVVTPAEGDDVITVTLERGGAAIRGRVIEDGINAPLAGFPVGLIDAGHPSPLGALMLQVTSSSDGGFEFAGLAPGRYQIVASDGRRDGGFSVARDEPVVVRSDSETPTLVRTVAALHRVVGSVVDTSGDPVANALVLASYGRVNGMHRVSGLASATDAHGRFELLNVAGGLERERIIVLVVAPGIGHANVRLSELPADGVVQLESSVPSTYLTVTAFLSSGLPAVDASVTLTPLAGGIERGGNTTDRDGTATIPLQDDLMGQMLRIDVRAPNNEYGTISVRADTSLADNPLTIVLKSGATITTRFHDGGTPVRGLDARLIIDTPDSVRWMVLQTTDADGRAVFENAPAGRAIVALYDNDRQADVFATQWFQLPPENHPEGDPLDFEYDIASVRWQVVGAVVDEDGNPIAGATLSGHGVDSPRAQPGRSLLQSDAEGIFRFTANQKFLSLTITHPEFRVGMLNLSRERDDDEPVVVTLERPHRLIARVIDENHHPIQGTFSARIGSRSVDAAPDGEVHPSGENMTLTSDAEGRIEIEATIYEQDAMFVVVTLTDGDGAVGVSAPVASRGKLLDVGDIVVHAARLSGTVRDAVSGDPVRDATVSLYALPWTLVHHRQMIMGMLPMPIATTDQEGRFTLPASLDNPTRLHVWHPDYLVQAPEWDPASDEPALLRPLLRWKGRVVGIPMDLLGPTCTVMISNADMTTPLFATFTPRESNEFEIRGVPRGPVRVDVHAPLLGSGPGWTISWSVRLALEVPDVVEWNHTIDLSDMTVVTMSGFDSEALRQVGISDFQPGAMHMEFRPDPPGSIAIEQLALYGYRSGGGDAPMPYTLQLPVPRGRWSVGSPGGLDPASALPLMLLDASPGGRVEVEIPRMAL